MHRCRTGFASRLVLLAHLGHDAMSDFKAEVERHHNLDRAICCLALIVAAACWG
jgi:hypothetical protein